jgi:hypothetical protein
VRVQVPPPAPTPLCPRCEAEKSAGQHDPASDNPAAPSYTCVKLTGASVRTEVLAMSKKYDHIIIDAGGRDTTSQRAALSVYRPRSQVTTSQNETSGDYE